MKTKLTDIDPYLKPHASAIEHRNNATAEYEARVCGDLNLDDVSRNYDFYGISATKNGWFIREWAPNATKIFLICEASEWKDASEFEFRNIGDGNWELALEAGSLAHLDLYKLSIHWNGGSGHRIPAYAYRVIQDEETKDFAAQVWAPKAEYQWQHSISIAVDQPLIYEAHVGMSSNEPEVATFRHFSDNVLPRIQKAGYNTIQLMGIQEHPYYGSFGYHVSSFFAASSRFGTPEELKALIDTAHGMGIAVIIDLVHSHSVKNVLEGLSEIDGTSYAYFHDGPRGDHPAWDSRCFNYGKVEVAKFLLSNCRFWLEEYKVDGYRFDGVTSMLYEHHGLARDFTSYGEYFEHTDADAFSYLSLANKLIHTIKPTALTVAEEMSGMPGLVWPSELGGAGFDYRLSMGTPDMWIKLIKEQTDEEWDLQSLLHELSQHRPEEKTISYAESHDQALVGDKTLIFRLIDKDMYDHMSKDTDNLRVQRGLALHKMIRLLTASTNSGGYLNFMGNEFGHPEWIDFPRQGNDWSYQYARRQWHLMDSKELAYSWLGEFDAAMIRIVTQLHGDTEYVTVHQSDHVLAYSRGDFVFVFNFNTSQSFTEYGLDAPAGSYELVLSSDDTEYGGQGLVSRDVEYLTGDNDQLKVYIPARSCLVFKRT